MKKHIALLGICCLSLVGFMTGCGHKPTPIKEGVVWKVVWSETTNSELGQFQEKWSAKTPQPVGSEFGVDMRGTLYTDFLVIRRADSSHTQIIPTRLILQLEFAD